MKDRIHYSKRREQALYNVIHASLMDVRIAILRGEYHYIGNNEKEERFFKQTKDLAESVCAEYRKSYAPIKDTP